MTRAGLVGYERGTRTEILEQPAGKPSKLWLKASLVSLAAEHGVTAETFGSHWALSKAAQSRRPVPNLPSDARSFSGKIGELSVSSGNRRYNNVCNTATFNVPAARYVGNEPGILALFHLDTPALTI